MKARIIAVILVVLVLAATGLWITFTRSTPPEQALDAHVPPPAPGATTEPALTRPKAPDAAHISEVHYLEVLDVDAKAGTANIAYSQPYWHDSTGIDLKTGKLSTLYHISPVSTSRNTPGSPNQQYQLGYKANGHSGRVFVDRVKGDTLFDMSIADLKAVTSFGWSPASDALVLITETDADRTRWDAYVCTIRDQRFRLVERDLAVHDLKWSSDGRYVVCIRNSAASKPDWRYADKRGIVTVLDAAHGFKPVLESGQCSADAMFSPSNRRIALVNRTLDEQGRIDHYELRVADLDTGRVRVLLTSSRRIPFVWAGDDLVVSVRDKYARPSLYLKSADGKRSTLLVSEPEFSRLEPSAYLPTMKRVVYLAKKGGMSGERPDELRAVEPGGKPVRLFPKNVRAAQ